MIKEEETEHKIYQYADDTTLFIKDIKSIEKVMEVLEKYCRGTGAKVNKEKTTYMRIGEMNELPDKIPFKEQKGNMKILGIRVGENENVIRNLIWEKVLKECHFPSFLYLLLKCLSILLVLSLLPFHIDLVELLYFLFIIFLQLHHLSLVLVKTQV